MYFIYVYTEAIDNVEGEAHPITISCAEQSICMHGGISTIRSLVEEEGLDWDTVTRVEVETGNDRDDEGFPDEDQPDTQICYRR